MTKRFIKDNRGQVLYAVIVTVMFLGVLSMIAMGLTLQHYHASVQKQERVSDYYAADAVAELIRIGKITVNGEVKVDAETFTVDDSGEILVKKEEATYKITAGTVTLDVEIQGDKFISWEVSYHAKQPAE